MLMMLKKHFLPQLTSEQNSSGFIALISVSIIGALLLVLAVGVSLRSISEGQMSLSEQFSGEASALAMACCEYGLIQLKNDLDYPGQETITIAQGKDCDILDIEGAGNENRVLKAQASSNGYFKKIRVEIAVINPLTEVISWQEVADF